MAKFPTCQDHWASEGLGSTEEGQGGGPGEKASQNSGCPRHGPRSKGQREAGGTEGSCSEEGWEGVRAGAGELSPCRHDGGQDSMCSQWKGEK